MRVKILEKNLNVDCATDRFVNEVLLNGEYSFVHKFKTVLDIGANIGTFSMYIYNNADVIYAVEPVTEEWEYLIKNIENNNLTKIIPTKCAIYDVNGTVNITTGGGGGGMVTFDKTKVVEEVPAVTLAQFINDLKIEYVDLIKIDVEAAEFPIFRSKDFKEVAGRIGMIVGEIHGPYQELRDILEPHGFIVDEVPGRHFKAWRKI